MSSFGNTKQDTRNKIIRAFWKLYQTTSIEKITVKNITDESGIYRTTFYLHFSDIYAVLEMIEEKLLADLRNVRTEEDPERCMKELHHVLKKDHEFLCVLLDGKRHGEFASVYENELAEKICRIYHICLEDLDDKAHFVIKKTLRFLRELIFDSVDSPVLTFHEAVQIVNGYLREGIIPTLQKEMKNVVRSENTL